MTADGQVAPGGPRLTKGRVAFLVLMVLPALIAFVVVLGAWAVSDEVYAAKSAARGAAGAAPVAAWKTTLVGICPIH